MYSEINVFLHQAFRGLVLVLYTPGSSYNTHLQSECSQEVTGRGTQGLAVGLAGNHHPPDKRSQPSTTPASEASYPAHILIGKLKFGVHYFILFIFFASMTVFTSFQTKRSIFIFFNVGVFFKENFNCETERMRSYMTKM